MPTLLLSCRKNPAFLQAFFEIITNFADLYKEEQKIKIDKQ